MREINGTLRVMKACTANSVKRCVMTSSFGAVRWTAKEDTPKDNVYDEESWSEPNEHENMSDFAISKTLAEETAWDY